MSTTPPLSLQLDHPDQLYIDGAWCTPLEGGTLELVSPDSETVVGRVVTGGAQDVLRAIKAARDAFDTGPWPRMPVAQRLGMVRALAQRLQARHPQIEAAFWAQVGGLKSVTPLLAAIGTHNIVDAVEAAEGFQFEQRVKSQLAPEAIVSHEPVGVVAAIAPWNSPYMLMTNKVGPALAAGCTVIMKPASQTPAEAHIIAECAHEVGLPKGVLNLVPCRPQSAEHLVSSPAVDHVSFTGSTEVGRRIASACGSRVARYTLELGGKSPAIVLDDFPIEHAAKMLARTITLMSGQICVMLSRAFVSKTRHDALADAIVKEMRTIKVGHSYVEDTEMGPLANRSQLDQVERYIEQGKREGATLATGGKRPAHLNRGYFIEPTLFANVRNDMTIAREEIFGPVLSLIPYDSVDDAIAMANDSVYGLHGSVLTHDASAARQVATRVRTGTFAQNGMKTDFSLPLGGYKQSGVGREGGVTGLSAYLETKSMLFDGPAQ
jgi:aldehyde dehydrogenase (NAD+)